MDGYDYHDLERHLYEDELYKDPLENVDAEHTDSAESDLEDNLLAHVNYNHSFTLEAEGDDDAEDLSKGDILPEDLTNTKLNDDEDDQRSSDMDISEDEHISALTKGPQPDIDEPDIADVQAPLPVMKIKSAASTDVVELEDLLTNSSFNHPRYFGSEIMCLFCRKTGHTAKSCPEKETACFLCKADHEPLKCPLADVCYRCWRRGHQYKDCDASRDDRDCAFCNEHHRVMECPGVWRQYIYTALSSSKSVPHERDAHIFCYECGLEGHFGDDCPHQGRSRRRGPARDGAFSVKSLRQEYKFERYRAQGVFIPPRRRSRSRSDSREKPPHRDSRERPPPRDSHAPSRERPRKPVHTRFTSISPSPTSRSSRSSLSPPRSRRDTPMTRSSSVRDNRGRTDRPKSSREDDRERKRHSYTSQTEKKTDLRDRIHRNSLDRNGRGSSRTDSLKLLEKFKPRYRGTYDGSRLSPGKRR
ncbi:hypothetical protein SpCBS45565_g03403 [Spizellomyces sp. 'palustris']|nr:hypothetical protein SpCBS45565_g03403 [Spizellomyces sp. 'palustris']